MTALARWCAKRRWYVVGAWVLALVALAAGALSAGDGFTNASSSSATESSRASSLMASAGLPSGNGGGKIVWHSNGASVQDPAVQTEVSAALTKIADLPGVAAVTNPYTQPETAATQLNASAGTAYATVAITSTDSIEAIRDIAAGLNSDQLQVAVGGQVFTEQPAAGGAAEGVGILAALVILLLVFRSAWAAVLPIITGIVGVATSLLLLILLSHVTDLSSNVITMGALVGLGVGIDYALFIVNRHRKALMGGKSVHDAVSEALNTSGRAVLFAGATVIIALLGVVVVDIDILTGMARGAALAVLLTVAAATTLLPALLSLIGLRVLSRRQRRELAAGPATPLSSSPTRSTLAERWSALVQRAPKRLGVLGLLVMVVLASPAVSLRLGSSDAGSDPVGTASREYADLMGAGFGDGVDATLSLVAATPDAASQQAFTDLSTRLTSVDDVAAVSPVATGTTPDGQSVSAITLTPSSSAQTEATADLVTALREDVIPATVAGSGVNSGVNSGSSNLQVLVGGTTASSIDSAQDVLSKLPLFLGLVALLGFLLLVIAFRSIVVPLVGALGNLLTLAVGLGVLVAAFQWGGLTGVLQLGSAAPVESLVPVLTIGIMFGLSMDYQVFLVSRMHEEYSRTGDNARAVRVGLAETARVIVTAAAIMFFVFAAFGFAGQRIVAEIGVGLAVAVLADAFILRLTIIPALMHLIGDRNWAYPSWAERITPRISIEGADTGTQLGADAGAVVPISRGHHDARPAGRTEETSGTDAR
ncbi:MMPL family transporter [Kineococcus sp. R86509]|uniref:MMPL family transporter n=1 Tax=Kineococcus sp. R86509 TaxID=3093851 RepID=UPI0036D37CAB